MAASAPRSWKDDPALLRALVPELRKGIAEYELLLASAEWDWEQFDNASSKSGGRICPSIRVGSLRSCGTRRDRPRAFRVEAVLEVNLEEASSGFLDCEKRAAWDSACADMRSVPELDCGFVDELQGTVGGTYYRNKAALGGAISPRDFIDVAVAIETNDVAQFAFTPADALEVEGAVVRRRLLSVGGSGHLLDVSAAPEAITPEQRPEMRTIGSLLAELQPEVKGCVRGINYSTGWVFEELVLEGGRTLTRMVFIMQTDLKGWLPKSLIQKGATGHLVSWVRHLAEFLQGQHCE